MLYAILGAAAALVLVFLWKFPKWQVSKVVSLDSRERFTLENEARKTLAQIIGGLLVLGGIYSAVMTLSVSQRNVLLSEQGQITDRFTKAVEQLGAADSAGAKRMEIRLGAIYALERIAKDSPRDHWAVMEVLTAYVRMNSPRQEDELEETSGQGDLAPPDKPGVDIRAVITVLARRTATHGAADDQPLDLAGTKLKGLVIGNWLSPDFRGVLFGGADLRWVQIHGADLREAEFHETDLRGAHLREADLRRAHLDSADIREAHLGSAILSGARMHDAKLRGAHLHRANLTGAIGLTQQQIDEAEGDSETKLPTGLRQPLHWSKPSKEEK